MTTYREYLDQIEALKRKADAARRSESQAAIREVRRLIMEFHLTPQELGLGQARQRSRATAGTGPTETCPPAARSGKGHARPRTAAQTAGADTDHPPSALKGRKVAPKYRGPNGELWTGRGRMPVWVRQAQAEGRSLDELTIR